MMMDVATAIKQRYSARAYKAKEIEEDKLRAVLEAARLAPSASNRQEWRFIVVRDKDRRRQLARAARDQAFVAEAPVVIVACAKTDNHIMTCGQLCYPMDVAITVDHITLEATELGLGTCWIGAFYEDKVKQILGIPQEIRVVALLPLGYPDGSPPVKRRLSVKEIAMWEKWR
ncbi:MAG: nitroreductase family protein [Candidatus Omnitrophota bacterium]